MNCCCFLELDIYAISLEKSSSMNWIFSLIRTEFLYPVSQHDGVRTTKAKFVYVSILVFLTFFTAPHARPRALPARAPRQCKKN